MESSDKSQAKRNDFPLQRLVMLALLSLSLIIAQDHTWGMIWKKIY